MMQGMVKVRYFVLNIEQLDHLWITVITADKLNDIAHLPCSRFIFHKIDSPIALGALKALRPANALVGLHFYYGLLVLCLTW